MQGSFQVEKIVKPGKYNSLAGLSPEALEGREQKMARVKKSVRRQRKIDRAESARIRCGGFKV